MPLLCQWTLDLTTAQREPKTSSASASSIYKSRISIAIPWTERPQTHWSGKTVALSSINKFLKKLRWNNCWANANRRANKLGIGRWVTQLASICSSYLRNSWEKLLIRLIHSTIRSIWAVQANIVKAMLLPKTMQDRCPKTSGGDSRYCWPAIAISPI